MLQVVALPKAVRRRGEIDTSVNAGEVNGKT